VCGCIGIRTKEKRLNDYAKTYTYDGTPSIRSIGAAEGTKVMEEEKKMFRENDEL
jgi:hypothetical protein